MKYLITGAGGQLGKEWARFLTANGSVFSAFNSTELDITNRELVTEILKSEKPDVVINCAAYTAVDKAESEPGKAFRVNRDGIRNLTDACLAVQSKMVHYSTDYVFSGNISDRELYPEGYPEDAPREPVNRYGESKYAGELELEKSQANWLLIRVSWLCGPAGSNFVNTMLKAGRQKDELKVVDDQFGSPSFTFDVVEKTGRLLNLNKKGMYHISSLGLLSWADFADEIFRQAGLDIQVIRIPTAGYPTAANRPAFSLLSNLKLMNTGLKPVLWKSGLKQLIQLINERS
jgi:dTDP-4-dehydrorhamnose reductase